MSNTTLQDLPLEVITLILQHVCELIVRDLTSFDFRCGGRNPYYGKTLNEFVQLLLVSRRFYKILSLCVRVDGKAIRKTLLDLQMQRLINFLEFGGGSKSEYQIHQIGRTCGYVWENPGAPDVILRLFDERHYQSCEAAVFHMCLLPKLLKKVLLKTNETISSALARSGDLESQEEQDKNSDDDLNGRLEMPEFENLVHNKTYGMNVRRHAGHDTKIEFVVGSYKFPSRLPDQTFGLGWCEGDWIGTSILRFKVTIISPVEEVAEKTFSGEEGSYWLWFTPHQKWILVDYVKSIAMGPDGCRYDLGKYGNQIYDYKPGWEY